MQALTASITKNTILLHTDLCLEKGMILKMKISWIKSKEDTQSFKMFKNLGFDVYDVEDLETVDKKINELVNENCKTIVLTNEIASFSEDIITKYNKSKDISIIIAAPQK